MQSATLERCKREGDTARVRLQARKGGEGGRGDYTTRERRVRAQSRVEGETDEKAKARARNEAVDGERREGKKVTGRERSGGAHWSRDFLRASKTRIWRERQYPPWCSDERERARKKRDAPPLRLGRRPLLLDLGDDARERLGRLLVEELLRLEELAEVLDRLGVLEDRAHEVDGRLGRVDEVLLGGLDCGGGGGEGR